MVTQITRDAADRLQTRHDDLGKRDAKPPDMVLVAIAVTLFALAIASLWSASRNQALPTAIGMAFLGSGLGGGGLYLTGRLLTRIDNRDKTFGLKQMGWVGIVAGPIVVGLGLFLRVPLLIPIGTLTFAAASMIFNGRIRSEGIKDPKYFLISGLVLVTVAWFVSSFASPNPMLLVLLVGPGLLLFKVGLPQFLDLDQNRTEWVQKTTAVSAVLALGGLFYIAMAASQRRGSILLAGFFLAFVSLSAFGPAARRLVQSDSSDNADNGNPAPREVSPSWLLLSGIGAGLAFFGAQQAFRFLGEWTDLKFLVAVLTVLIGAAFVLRGETLLVLVMLTFVAVWVLADRTVEEPSITDDTERPILVALGDSYMAGQGGHDFYAGTNSKDPDKGNTCRRSPDAFAVRTANKLDMDAINWACSGALIEHLIEPQAPEDDDGNPIVTTFTPAPQLANPANLDPGDLQRIEVVLMTFGGNDAFFSTVVVGCLLPADCSDRKDFFLRQLDLLPTRLEAAYQATAEVFPQAEVVVVPYPQLLDADTDCGLAINADERKS